MGARTRLHADARVWQVRRVSLQVFARELLPDHNPAVLVESHEMKGVLAQIDADRSDVHVMILQMCAAA